MSMKGFLSKLEGLKVERPKTFDFVTFVFRQNCGEYRSRTDDLLRARQAL
jgi:hypothetical protein